MKGVDDIVEAYWEFLKSWMRNGGQWSTVENRSAELARDCYERGYHAAMDDYRSGTLRHYVPPPDSPEPVVDAPSDDEDDGWIMI